jgi:hypothetical protein
VIESSLRAVELGYKFNKTAEGKLTFRIERMKRVSRENEDIKEQDAVSFPVPQSNNSLNRSASQLVFHRELELFRQFIAFG